jgi:hypothetical protein
MKLHYSFITRSFTSILFLTSIVYSACTLALPSSTQPQIATYSCGNGNSNCIIVSQSANKPYKPYFDISKVTNDTEQYLSLDFISLTTPYTVLPRGWFINGAGAANFDLSANNHPRFLTVLDTPESNKPTETDCTFSIGPATLDGNLSNNKVTTYTYKVNWTNGNYTECSVNPGQLGHLQITVKPQ